MLADKIVLQMKYARIVRLFADRLQIPYEEALAFSIIQILINLSVMG